MHLDIGQVRSSQFRKRTLMQLISSNVEPYSFKCNSLTDKNLKLGDLGHSQDPILFMIPKNLAKFVRSLPNLYKKLIEKKNISRSEVSCN